MKVRDYSIGKDAFNFFFSLIGIFNHYSFFTKKLWKKVDGFENGERVVCVDIGYQQCIPYNDETKHLVGTLDDCPEYYKWWEE